MARFWVRVAFSGARYQLRLYGELDGSTACRVLDAIMHVPSRAQEVVINLAGLSRVENFGLEVLARGVRQCARGRRVLVIGAPAVSRVTI
jgi:anti-anti-sigma factor